VTNSALETEERRGVRSMALDPPVAPMLARLARELPAGDYLYEPKWDGFRALAFVTGAEVDIRSRHDRPLSRYFPELVDPLTALPGGSCVIDGEIAVVRDGRFDFAALMSRLHPAATRVERLRRESPAVFVAFDVLALGAEDVRERPFAERRQRLADLLGGARPPLFLTPATADRGVAQRWLDRYQGAGVDGVVAKHRELRYLPGARAMVKVKREQTLDCVVAGYRLAAAPEGPLVASLMLGLYDGTDAGRLEHIGVVSAFARHARRTLHAELRGLEVPLAGHPWEQGFLVEGGPLGRLRGSAGRWVPGMTMDWVPLAPERVAEVAYDHADGTRLRHPARFRRWRPDREPRSCTTHQLVASSSDVAGLLTA
jgi:ATP-dependent DNA ligase